MLFKKNGVQIKGSYKIEIAEGFLRPVEALRKDSSYGPAFLLSQGITAHENKPRERINEYTTRRYSEVTDDGFYHRWEFVEEIVDEDVRLDVESQKTRAERNALLDKTDRPVLALERAIRQAKKNSDDYAAIEASLSAWDDYRDALCTVPDQAGFPFVVEWPVAPDTE